MIVVICMWIGWALGLTIGWFMIPVTPPQFIADVLITGTALTVISMFLLTERR